MMVRYRFPRLPARRQALVGRFRQHHALLVSQMLAHLDYLEEAIEQLSEPIAEPLRPFAAMLAPLDAIPEVNQRTIEGIVADIGLDVRPFPLDRHLVSWSGLCPGHHESAGKRRIGTPWKGNRWLRYHVGRSGHRGGSRQRQSARRPLSAHHASPGHKKAVLTVAQHHPRDCLSHAQAREPVLRTRGRVSQSARTGTRHAPLCQTTGAFGPPRDL